MAYLRVLQRSVPKESESDAAVAGLDTVLVRRLVGRGDMISFAADDLADSISEIAESAGDTANSASRASTATGQVAVEATAVASAAEEMSAAMQEVSSSAAFATQVAQEAGGVVQEVVSSVHRLSTSTERIDGVVRTVSGISDQTRLLALNATIEAARAGAAGRGFAVVAEEVKNLANQTTAATGEIAGQLSDLVTDSERVRDAVERIDEVLRRVLTLQQTIAAAVEEQSAVIAEITRSASAVATATESLEESVHASAHAAETAQHAIDRAQLWVNRLRSTSVAQRRDRERIGAALGTHPLRAALEGHAAWKDRIHTAITTGRVPAELDLVVAARDDACDFGRWLRSDEARRLDPARTAALMSLHAEFHTAAADVFQRVADRRTGEAQALFRSADGYGHAAPQLMDALMDWLSAVGEA